MNKEAEKFNFGKLSTVNFNVLVVGERGCGKSTFAQSFAEAYTQQNSSATDRLLVSDSIDCFIHIAERSLVRRNELADFLTKKHDESLAGKKEQNALDPRIHCLVYMFGPHRVLDTDKECLKSVRGLVPIVPVLAKADSLTVSEREQYLQEISDLMTELDRTSDIVPALFKFTGHERTSGDAQDPTSNLSQGDNASAVQHDTVSAEKSETPVACHGDTSEPADTSAQHSVAPSTCSYVYLSSSGHDTPDSTRLEFGTPTSPLSTETLDSNRGTEPLPPMSSPLAAPAVEAERSATQPAEHSDAGAGAAAAPPTSPTSKVHADHKPSPVSTAGLQNIFALVCSTEASGLREYPWGPAVTGGSVSVSAYDERVPDFRRLQRLVFERGNIARLRDLTQSIRYTTT